MAAAIAATHLQLAALGDGARDDGGGGGGEGVLEEPRDPVVAVGVHAVVLVLDARQREAVAARADERVGPVRAGQVAVGTRARVAVVREAEADEVPRDGADARVEQVLRARARGRERARARRGGSDY